MKSFLTGLLFVIFLAFGLSAGANQTGPFRSTIKQLQIHDLGNPYNTLWINLDVTTSPCADTNTNNRFEIKNTAQLSTLLSALMANMTISVYGKGVCNTADIEELNVVIIAP